MRRALALVLLAGLCAGCGGRAPVRTAPPPTPSNTLPPVLLGVGGDVVVTDLSAVKYDADGTHCVTTGRYADVAAGARVILSGTRGSRAAVTQLGQGVPRDGRGGRKPGCDFPFSSENVPNRHPAFLIRVGDQKPVRVEAADLSAGRALVTLG